MKLRTEDKIIIFDVEGVLIPKARFLFFETAGKMGVITFMKAIFYGVLYEIGLFSLNRSMKSLYRLLRGLQIEAFLSFFEHVPLMPCIEQVIKELRKDGFRVALISSGIPRVALEKMNEKIGADYLFGLEISFSENRLTGEIWGDVLEHGGKALSLKKILLKEGLLRNYRIGVADDRNNLSMLELCDLRIACKPDFLITQVSDYIIKEDISEILPIVKGEAVKDDRQSLSFQDIIRESIHLGGFIVLLLCKYFINWEVILTIILIVSLVYIMSEVGRMFGKNMPIISYMTSKASGKLEFQEPVTSPIFYALAVIGTLLFFSKPVGYTSLAVLTLGDSCATIFGKLFGRRHIPFNKSKNIEGTLFGLLAAFLGSLFFVDPVKALVASSAGMLIELFPSPVNDNLTIPLASGLALASISAFL